MQARQLRLTGSISSQNPKAPFGTIPLDTRKPPEEAPTILHKTLKDAGLTYDQFDALMTALSGIEKIMRNKNEMGQGAGAQIERYCGIRNTSDFGKECQFAKKAAHLFLAADILPKLLDAIKKVEDERTRLGIQNPSGAGPAPSREGEGINSSSTA
jgi:hypothetical protein